MIFSHAGSQSNKTCSLVCHHLSDDGLYSRFLKALAQNYQDHHESSPVHNLDSHDQTILENDYKLSSLEFGVALDKFKAMHSPFLLGVKSNQGLLGKLLTQFSRLPEDAKVQHGETMVTLLEHCVWPMLRFIQEVKAYKRELVLEQFRP